MILLYLLLLRLLLLHLLRFTLSDLKRILILLNFDDIRVEQRRVQLITRKFEVFDLSVVVDHVEACPSSLILEPFKLHILTVVLL